jgi:hypothetical protein
VLAGSTWTDECFLQQQTLVTLGVIAHSCQPVKSMLDVKRWGLEVERGENHLPAVTAAGFLLGGLE